MDSYPILEDWLASPSGGMPILRLSVLIRNAIGSRFSVAMLPAWLVMKNRESHPEIEFEDYLKLCSISDKPDAIAQINTNSVVIAKSDGASYLVTIEANVGEEQETVITGFQKAALLTKLKIRLTGKLIYGSWE